MDSTELEAGWNTKNFKTIVSDVSEFEGIWDQLFQDTLPLVQKASIRAAWKQLQNSSVISGNPASASATLLRHWRKDRGPFLLRFKLPK